MVSAMGSGSVTTTDDQNWAPENHSHETGKPAFHRAKIAEKLAKAPKIENFLHLGMRDTLKRKSNFLR